MTSPLFICFSLLHIFLIRNDKYSKYLMSGSVKYMESQKKILYLEVKENDIRGCYCLDEEWYFLRAVHLGYRAPPTYPMNVCFVMVLSLGVDMSNKERPSLVFDALQ